MIRYSRACGSYEDSLDRGLLLTKKLLNQLEVFYCLGWNHLFEILLSALWLGVPLWNICVANDYGYVSLVVSTSRSFTHSWLITRFVTRVPWRVPLVERNFRSTQVHPRLLVGFVLFDLSFLLSVLYIVVCPFVPFLLAIVLSVRLRFTILIIRLVSTNSSYTRSKKGPTSS